MTKTIDHKISESRRLLENPYAHLDDKGGFSAIEKPEFRLEKNDVLGAVGRKANYSLQDIEIISKRLQNLIWKNRTEIWKSNTPTDPIEVLDPEIAIRALGYKYEQKESLGQFSSQGKRVEVAGFIDNDQLEISLSRQFPRYIQNYTAAHEIGHSLLHQTSGLHRDRALDGTLVRDGIEFEADKFAAFFLMEIGVRS